MKRAKRWMGWLAVCGLLAGAAPNASAAIAIVDGIPWFYNIEEGEASIVQGPGSGDVAIPSALDGYPVRQLADNAFLNCSGLTSVAVPDSVTNIGSKAFSGCSGLKSVSIPDSVTHIGEGAFQNCSGLAEMKIPDNATGVWDGMFSGCTGLETLYVPLTWAGTPLVAGLDMPSSCTVICGDRWEEVDGAVWSYDMSDREPVVIAGPREGTASIPSEFYWGGYVTGIEAYAFYGCSGLTEVMFPEKELREIGPWAFAGCSGLTSLLLPDCVTNIGEMAFAGCSGLETLSVPKALKWSPMMECLGIPKGCRVIYRERSVEWRYELIPEEGGAIIWGAEPATGILEIPSELDGYPVTAIGGGAFHGCDGLTSVMIPDSVLSIGAGAFEGCYGSDYGLESVVIGNGVTNIGEAAFAHCRELTNVVIGNGVTSIEPYAFLDCRNLASLVIPESVTYIGDRAFDDCTGLRKLYVPASWEDRSIVDWGYEVLPDGCEIVYGTHWFYDVDWDGALITGVEPAMGNLLIPSELEGEPVTRIETNAFENCARLTSVAIPDTVTNIGAHAFSGCIGLVSVALPAGLTIIGEGAFSGCRSLLSMDIPDNVEHIGENAFSGCRGLVSLVLPEHLRSIGDCAFRNCSSLAVMSMPERRWGSIEIGKDAFAGCTGLKKLYFPGYEASMLVDAGLPEECEVIDGKQWRYDWSSDGITITGVDFAEGIMVFPSKLEETPVTRIGGGAFEGCNELEAVIIPDSVTNIGGGAFSFCHGLESLTMGNGVETIEDYAFEECDRLTSLSIPGSVTDIGYKAFTGCRGLTTMTLPSSVTNIGNWAFHDTNLQTLFVPFSWAGSNMLEDIGLPGGCEVIYGDRRTPWAYIVSNGVAIVSGRDPAEGDLEIPSEWGGFPVTGIGERAFEWCTGVTSITIPDNLTEIGSGAFRGCTGLGSVAIGYSVASIGTEAFKGCTGLTSVTIPTSVTEVGEGVFSGSALKTLSVPGSWEGTAMLEGAGVPEGCTVVYRALVFNHAVSDGEVTITGVESSERKLTIPSEVDGFPVTAIGERAFAGHGELAAVVIPDSVTSIGEGAFHDCSGLISVRIPDCVTSIGNEAFCGCGNLGAVRIPDSVRSIGNEAFGGCAEQLYDTRSIAGLRLLDGWAVGQADSYILSPSLDLRGLRGIAGGAFSWCTGLTSVMLPENMTSIGDRTFYGCSSLTSVTIPEGVTSIGSSAFYGCSSLISVVIPESVTSIGTSAFSGCNGLTNVTILGNIAADWSYSSFSPFYKCTNISTLVLGGKMTEIGYRMFYGCSGLTSVTISDSVTSIGTYAFRECSGLTSVTIPDSVTSIGQEAFSGCRGLRDVTIGNSVTSIGRGAFHGCNSLASLYAPESWKTKHVYDYWTGEDVFWSSYARVPSGCEIIYYALRKTSTGVPYAWLEEHGLGNGTAEGYEAVASTNAANGLNKVWECYVAGLDPTDPAARFTAEIVFTNGVPVVSWTPDLNEKGTKSERSYEVEGIPAMTNAWDATNAASRFFRVKVALPQP